MSSAEVFIYVKVYESVRIKMSAEEEILKVLKSIDQRLQRIESMLG